MNNNIIYIKNMRFLFSIFLVTMISIFNIACAGSLTPIASPAALGYTAADLFNRLSANTTAVAGDHSFTPTTTPQSTFQTLSDIYTAIPTIYPTDFLASSTYLGITGTIAVKTGDNAITTSATSTNKLLLTVPGGFYDGTVTVSTTSTAFTAANIKIGAYLFGIVGSLLEALGDASAGDVLSGKTFSNSTASNITGTIPVKTGDDTASSTATSTQKILLAPAPGYYDGVATVSTTSVGFDPTNIKNGTYLLGMTGTYSGYPGSGWTANAGTVGVDPGTTPLNQTTCDAQTTANWAWFADMNNDGDTTDAEDGVCVQTKANQSALPNVTWNGAILIGAARASTTASGGTYNTITTATTLTANIYASTTVRFASATNSCFGIGRSNTTGSITIYGQWLKDDYSDCPAVPANGDTFQIYQDGKYDNSWIGDYTCAGNFPGGTVVAGSNPSSDDTGALASADCFDGKRDLLPNETDRAVMGGTITAIVNDAVTGTSTITDSNLTGSFDDNAYVGQKLLITAGTGAGSWGIIERNTSISSSTNVTAWSATTPEVGSSYQIIYIIPRGYLYGSFDAKQNNGPLTTEALKSWKGTRLPTSMDWFGYCGKSSATTAAGNGAYVVNSADPYSLSKTYGNYGGQLGRTNQLLNLANSGNYEWLSEPSNIYNARVAGIYACSYINHYSVNNSYRFRAVFRP